MDIPNVNVAEESELRKLDLTTLAEQSREAWKAVEGDIPAEIRERIAPHFNVLTDPGFLTEKVEEMAGLGTRSGR